MKETAGMKHKMGWPTRCDECFWYCPKQPQEKMPYDGYCGNRKLFKNMERLKVEAIGGYFCEFWEDAENRLTAFEVKTRTPGQWRTESEQEYIKSLLGVSDNDGKRRY